MNLFSRFSSKEVDQFARSLVADIVKRYPSNMDTNRTVQMSVERLTRILENTFEKAREFQALNKLGIYRKARLSNTFKWELKENGYSDDFIDVATEGLVVYLSKGSLTQ